MEAIFQQSEPETVVPLRIGVPEHELRREWSPELVAAVRAGLDIVSARLLALLAVIGGIAIWAWAVTNPAQWTFIISCGYSAGIVLPTVWLHSKKG